MPIGLNAFTAGLYTDPKCQTTFAHQAKVRRECPASSDCSHSAGPLPPIGNVDDVPGTLVEGPSATDGGADNQTEFGHKDSVFFFSHFTLKPTFNRTAVSRPVVFKEAHLLPVVMTLPFGKERHLHLPPFAGGNRR
jgi:hypothetical protein